MSMKNFDLTVGPSVYGLSYDANKNELSVVEYKVNKILKTGSTGILYYFNDKYSTDQITFATYKDDIAESIALNNSQYEIRNRFIDYILRTVISDERINDYRRRSYLYLHKENAELFIEENDYILKAVDTFNKVRAEIEKDQPIYTSFVEINRAIMRAILRAYCNDATTGTKTNYDKINSDIDAITKNTINLCKNVLKGRTYDGDDFEFDLERY